MEWSIAIFVTGIHIGSTFFHQELSYRSTPRTKERCPTSLISGIPRNIDSLFFHNFLDALQIVIIYCGPHFRTAVVVERSFFFFLGMDASFDRLIHNDRKRFRCGGFAARLGRFLSKASDALEVSFWFPIDIAVSGKGQTTWLRQCTSRTTMTKMQLCPFSLSSWTQVHQSNNSSSLDCSAQFILTVSLELN